MVIQVSAIEGLHAPPMQAKFGGVPSPLDHQALCLVIALIYCYLYKSMIFSVSKRSKIMGFWIRYLCSTL